jgi:PAS domain S-box-containing protein
MTESHADTGGRVPAHGDPMTATVEVALLDRSGVIIAVNDAWTAFAAANGGDPYRCGIGVSYLGICDGCLGDRYADAVGAAIRAALAGDLPAPVQVALPCHGPDAPRWFDVLVSSRFDDAGACAGATLTLSPVLPSARTGRHARPEDEWATGPAVPAFYPEPSERLGDVFAQLVLDRLPIGILVVDDQGTVVRAGRAAEHLFGAGPDTLVGLPFRHLLPEVDPFDHRLRPDLAVAGAAWPVLSTDALREDGSAVPVEVRVGCLPLSRGTGAVVLVRDELAAAAPYAPDQVVYLDHDIGDIMDELDEVVRLLFTSGLTATGVAAARQEDRALATTLVGVTGDLDRAIRGLRSVAFRFRQSGRREPFPRPPT